jgi:hypothetical protein
MEFCSVVLRQIDENTAEIRTVVNTDVLMVLFRKKQSTTEFYTKLKAEMIFQLGIEFGIDFDDPFSESMGELQQRTHKGYTEHGHSFVSVLSIVKIKSEGGGLTEDLSGAIISIIQEALSEETPPPMSQEETVQILGWLSEKMEKQDHNAIAFYDKRFKSAVDRAVELLRV